MIGIQTKSGSVMGRCGELAEHRSGVVWLIGIVLLEFGDPDIGIVSKIFTGRSPQRFDGQVPGCGIAIGQGKSQ